MQNDLNSPWIDSKYVKLLSTRLDRFRVINEEPILANFRCPVCGDSQHNKYKARGYLYTREGKVNFNCHNCGAGSSLKNFLKSNFNDIYKEYCLERRIETKELQHSKKEVVLKKEVKLYKDIPPGLKSMSSLNQFHPAVKYWNSRKLPQSRMDDVYWTENYSLWINENVQPGKFKNVHTADSRIVFPVRDFDGNITGFSGRAIDTSAKQKYSSVTMPNVDSMSFYGSHLHSPEEVRFIVEGPIDSLSVDRCVALMGISRNTNDFKNATFILDNEPRNSAVVSKMKKLAQEGKKIFVWAKSPHKDLNDLVVNGMTKLEIQKMIDTRTFTGLKAQIEISFFAKHI